MENAELIKALQCCIVDFNSTQSRRCNECPYGIYADGKKDCENKVKRDAANALKADEQQIVELQKQVNEFIKNETRSTVIKVMSKRIAELEAQMPKDGEWIHGRELGKEWLYDHWVTYFEDWRCSNCGVVFEQESKPKYHYCPNCGAKMKFNDKQKTESKNTKSSLEYDYCGTPKRRYDIDARMKGE